LILIEALSSACWEEKKKKERETAGGRAFFPVLDTPCWLFHAGFL
jgi:hypothetical protein